MMLFFPKYKIAANPVFLTVTSGVKGADILIDGQKVAVTDSEKFSRQLGAYLPGLYNVEGKAKGAFEEMDNITKVDFIKDKEQNKIINALQSIMNVLKISSCITQTI
ncbi:hypothetical protein [Clostridium tyrobutyricum]|uniref:hypothetical protein n=1 Tax=Clostridium tyrobutyricum TaxID=1519 RepID=UPI0011C781E0|nr:hypothetical protein [Clostridium tyrobutyricum]